MNFENLCQVCQEKLAPYKCPKCQIRYCSLTCYRDSSHNKCSKEFDENEFMDSMNFDEDNSQNPMTTTNDFVRERIEDIMKRKLEEKDFHNEDDDEQIEDLFEHILPTKDSENYREVNRIDYIFIKVILFYFYRDPLISTMRKKKKKMMAKVKMKVKNVLLVMKNHYQIYQMILTNPMRI